jgi:phenylalanyl-tRNA synthetase beta chain
MPTIDIDYAEFERLLGVEFNKDLDRINDALAFVKGEVKLFDEKEGTMSVEIKDTNRPDTWNVEGLVRALRGFLGIEEGLKDYSIGSELVEVLVSPQLEGLRPFIGCATVTELNLNDSIIRGFMRTQDKLDQTYGRNRRRTSIGLYNLDLIKLPLRYTVAAPKDVSFVPLGFSEKMTLKDMLSKHPKGIEYGGILRGRSVYPLLVDAEDNPLSLPPIINSNDLGRITETTRNVLVEVTGTMEEAVLNTLKIVTLSLIDRGGVAKAAKIRYAHRTKITPDLATSKMDLSPKYTCKILGLQLASNQIAKLLLKARYGITKIEPDLVRVEVPCYRVDVMHPVDVVEDVAIAYDYNKIRPLWREMLTTGSMNPEHLVIDTSRESMIGLGFQEILTYTLTNPTNLFKKMNCKKKDVIEISNPKVNTLTCLRNWLLPNLLSFVSNNLHVECPQKIFELGNITVPDKSKETKTRDVVTLAAVIYDADASFTEVKSTLDSLVMNLGLRWSIERTEHPSFIEGRTGKVMINGRDVGVIGEINPKVLEAWSLENPAAAMELNIHEIIKMKL